LALTSATAVSALAQGAGQIASGTISGTGSGPFTYSLSFSDAASATAPIGSVWYAWLPGLFYLPGAPTSASAPSGWTATIVNNSIQYVANSPAFDILPGDAHFGFSYTANFSPAQLAATAMSGTSVAYSGNVLSDSGDIFTVSTVPEPSAGLLLLCGATLFRLVGWRKLLAA
jgi:hypothetical protein